MAGGPGARETTASEELPEWNSPNCGLRDGTPRSRDLYLRFRPRRMAGTVGKVFDMSGKTPSDPLSGRVLNCRFFPFARVRSLAWREYELSTTYVLQGTGEPRWRLRPGQRRPCRRPATQCDAGERPVVPLRDSLP